MEFRTLHVGGPLRLWEKCCLRSFADFGHEVTVFGYEPLDLPEGVHSAPAQEVLTASDRDRFFEQAPRAYSRFSDLFRYLLLERYGGWWVDTDVLCLSDHIPDEEIILGWEDDKLVCGAIMRMPKGHPMLQQAIVFSRKNAHVDIRSHLGPHLLTKVAAEYGLSSLLSEPGRLYPVHWSAAFDLVDPAACSTIESLVEGSFFVHLWRGLFEGSGFQTDFMPPAGSFLAKAFARHGGDGTAMLDADAVAQQIRIVRERGSLLQETG